jgi:hypothetical protein
MEILGVHVTRNVAAVTCFFRIFIFRNPCRPCKINVLIIPVLHFSFYFRSNTLQACNRPQFMHYELIRQETSLKKGVVEP